MKHLERKLRKTLESFLVFAGIGFASQAGTMREALALPSFVPSSISALTSQDKVDSLLSTIALGADHRDYMPASDMGILLGFDVGVDFSAIRVPSEFADIFNSVTGQNIPAYLPVPRLNLHKGLPFGIDLGFSYFGYSDPNFEVKMYGGSVKWAFLPGGLVLPSVAVKATGNYSSLGFINTHTYKLDVMASKNFLLFEPYVGAGLQKWSGELGLSGSLGSLPASVSADSSGTNLHYYGGLMVKLLLVRLAAEVDHSTAGVSTAGMKFSVGF